LIRIVFALAALLLVAQLSGFGALVGEAVGSEACRDDAAQGDCPPDCGACACCPHGQVLLAAPLVGIAPPDVIVRASWVEIQTPLTSADAREILHVPRRLA
jgi:hypothetical protein